MLKIRLKRIGRKQKPSYRVVVIDSRKKRDGRFIEEVGFYSPLKKEINLNLMQIQKRIKSGAKMSSTVHNLVEKCNIK